jgi:hypothetical protein
MDILPSWFYIKNTAHDAVKSRTEGPELELKALLLYWYFLTYVHFFYFMRLTNISHWESTLSAVARETILSAPAISIVLPRHCRFFNSSEGDTLNSSRLYQMYRCFNAMSTSDQLCKVR